MFILFLTFLFYPKSFVFKGNFGNGSMVDLALLRRLSGNHFQCIGSPKACVLRPWYSTTNQRSVAVVLLFEFNGEYGVARILQYLYHIGAIGYLVLCELLGRIRLASHDILRYCQRFSVFVHYPDIAILFDVGDGVIHSGG